MPATIPPWVIVKFRDQIAPSLGSFAAMSLDELVQHFEELLLAGALAMRALFADPQLGVSTIDAATAPIGRQPNLRKIAERFA